MGPIAKLSERGAAIDLALEADRWQDELAHDGRQVFKLATDATLIVRCLVVRIFLWEEALVDD